MVVCITNFEKQTRALMADSHALTTIINPKFRDRWALAINVDKDQTLQNMGSKQGL